MKSKFIGFGIISLIVITLATACGKDPVTEENTSTNPLIGYRWTYVMERVIDEVNHRNTDAFVFNEDSIVHYTRTLVESYMGESRERVHEYDWTYSFDGSKGEMVDHNADVASGYEIHRIELDKSNNTLLWYRHNFRTIDGKRDSFYVLQREPLN